jgi:CBS domain-containing protein
MGLTASRWKLFRPPRTAAVVAEPGSKNSQALDLVATLREAAQQMRAPDIGALPVCDGHRVVGILTERDLTARAAAEGRDPMMTKVHEVMTPELIACVEDQEGADALRLMHERQIRHLAVLSRDRRLVGIISLRGVIRLSCWLIFSQPAITPPNQPASSPATLWWFTERERMLRWQL